MAASTGGLGAVGAPAALGLLVLSEAAVPIPFPADLLMLLVGERAAAGALPLWAAALGLEAATVIGTTALFLALRGPARAVIPRIGPRVGLTEVRIARSCEVLERRGRIAVALGRGTPGLRTLTVAASAVSGMRARWVLPALVVGASAFVQLHLVMGYVLGEAAREALELHCPSCWSPSPLHSSSDSSCGAGCAGASGPRRCGRRPAARPASPSAPSAPA